MQIKIRLDPTRDRQAYDWFALLPPGTRAHFLRMATERVFASGLMPPASDIEPIGRAWRGGVAEAGRVQHDSFGPAAAAPTSAPVPFPEKKQAASKPLLPAHPEPPATPPPDSGGGPQPEGDALAREIERMRRMNRF